jgi:hypothetical protein
MKRRNPLWITFRIFMAVSTKRCSASSYAIQVKAARSPAACQPLSRLAAALAAVKIARLSAFKP